MLEDAFKMMGEEKDGVIRVHKEAERKLKLMQQEYEVPFSNWKRKPVYTVVCCLPRC